MGSAGPERRASCIDIVVLALAGSGVFVSIGSHEIGGSVSTATSRAGATSDRPSRRAEPPSPGRATPN